MHCRNPTLRECEDETHIPEMGTWESFGILEILEFDYRGQNTLHWGVFYIIKKLSKCRCRKWVRMGHLDICSTHYGKKKGMGVKLAVWLPTIKSRKSTRPRCMQVECNRPLEISREEVQVCFKPHPNRRFEQRVMTWQSPESPNQDNFRTPPWESRDKKTIWM